MPTIHIQLKEEEFIDAAKAASAPSRAWFLFAAAALLGILTGLIWLWQTGYGRESIAGLVVLVGAGIGGWIGRGLSIRGRAKRIFRQQKGLNRPYDLSWTSEAITLTAEHGTSTIRWPDFHKRRETADQFLLFLSDANFLMVPKRAFPDTTLLGTFRDIVTAQIPAR